MPIHSLLLVLDNRKGRVDVAHIVAVDDAVEMKKYCVELSAQVQAAVLVSVERWFDCSGIVHMAKAAGKRGHIVGGVGEIQYRLAHDLTGRLGAEAGGLVTIRRHDGKLLNNEPIEVLSLNFLAHDIIKWYGIEIGGQRRNSSSRKCVRLQ